MPYRFLRSIILYLTSMTVNSLVGKRKSIKVRKTITLSKAWLIINSAACKEKTNQLCETIKYKPIKEKVKPN